MNSFIFPFILNHLYLITLCSILLGFKITIGMDERVVN